MLTFTGTGWWNHQLVGYRIVRDRPKPGSDEDGPHLRLIAQDVPPYWDVNPIEAQSFVAVPILHTRKHAKDPRANIAQHFLNSGVFIV